jgi:hypothetical protein
MFHVASDFFLHLYVFTAWVALPKHTQGVSGSGISLIYGELGGFGFIHLAFSI